MLIYQDIFFFCSRESYNALTNWLTDARTLASPNIVIVLVGNKKDLDSEREVTFLEASRFAQENGKFCVNSTDLSTCGYPSFIESSLLSVHSQTVIGCSTSSWYNAFMFGHI